MTILSERERLYDDELVLLNDGANTYQTTAQTYDWTTRKSVSFTLTKAQLVMLRFYETLWAASNGTIWGGGRATVDGLPVFETGAMTKSNGSVTVTSPDVYVMLAAGSHTINFDDSVWYIVTVGEYSRLGGIYVGRLNFNDLVTSYDYSGVKVVSGATLVTMITRSITLPARKTPVGAIQKYSVFVYMCARDASAAPTRKTLIRNYGEGNTDSRINVRCTFQDWINNSNLVFNPRYNDYSAQASNPTWTRGSCGVYVGTFNAGMTFNVLVEACAPSLTASAEVWCWCVFCPWMTPMADYSPIDLDFPQGSTFYAWLEPLYQDVTKSSKIGFLRFKSFGDATDYYSILSGTGIIQHSYTLDIVNVSSPVWTVSTTVICCISHVAVDVR